MREQTIRIPSLRSNIVLVEEFLVSVCEAFTLGEDVLDRAMISVTEAVNNGIIHGNKANPEKAVFLSCREYLGYIEFVVRDQGGGFDPQSLPDPLHEDNLLKEGGRGVLIINAMMDAVEYRSSGDGMEIHMRIIKGK